MKSRILNSCIRLFALCAVLWFSLPLFAADKHFTEGYEDSDHNVCERLLEGDLSGYFVATNVTSNQSQVVKLSRLGATSAYTIAVATLELASSGIRELEFVRSAQGWLIGDPGNPEARVNLVTILREGGQIRFRFENASDPYGFAYDATPPEEADAIKGDILRPDQWSLRFHAGFDADVKFTRVKLDRSFELAVSQPLKSLLATKLEPGEHGIEEYLVTVQMKRPMMVDHAEDILGMRAVPLDVSNGPYYRFSVRRNIFELLESIGDWTKHWQVAHVDAVPMNMVLKMAQVGATQIKEAQGQTLEPQTPAQRTLNSPNLRPSPQQPQERATGLSTDALRELQTFSNNHPRDLDQPNGDDDHEEDHDGDRSR